MSSREGGYPNRGWRIGMKVSLGCEKHVIATDVARAAETLTRMPEMTGQLAIGDINELVELVACLAHEHDERSRIAAR